jgi:nucleoside phosphorylase
MILRPMHASLAPCMRPLVLITALSSEASPFITAWEMKPVRSSPLLERFQVAATSDRKTFVAVSGIGKLKSATATAAVYSALSHDHSPLVANIGIAGAPTGFCELGSVFLVNKVRDVASNLRFYPDILIRHRFTEAALETYDAPVTSAPPVQALVDMEAAGFMQAATLLVAPSEIAVIKVVSDFCDGTRTTSTAAHELIVRHVSDISDHLDAMRQEVSEHPRLSASERELLDAVVAGSHFSQTQRLELTRALVHRKAKDLSFIDELKNAIAQPARAKPERSAVFQRLIEKLRETTLP